MRAMIFLAEPRNDMWEGMGPRMRQDTGRGNGGSRTAPTKREDGWRCGQDWGMDSRLCLHEAGSAREQQVGMWGEGEHEKRQVSNLPLCEGKYRYYVGEGLAVREPPLRGTAGH